MDKSYQIYLIEDINDLRYYGMTCSPLQKRFSEHRSKYNNEYGACSSCKLNLYNSIITCLENNLTEKEAREREKYYIKNNECVNELKYKTIDETKKTKKEYYEKNKVILREKKKEFYQKNKDKLCEVSRKYREENKDKSIERIKKWRKNNKDKIKSYKRMIWHCDICNCDLTLGCKSRHLKTEKHINNSLK